MLFSCSFLFGQQTNFKTKHVIIVVMDGARYQETFGDTTHQYIPYLNRLKTQGILHTNFQNDGYTLTNAGHTAILTGNYKPLKNNGKELPDYPNIFQYYQKEKGVDKYKTWIATSKGKLEVLANTKNKTWWNRYMPATYCGVKGQSVVYQNDNIHFEKVKEIITDYHPELMLVNFLEADARGHQNNWDGYVGGIKNIDRLTHELWNFIQNDPEMKDNTTLFITNDHGRHNDGRRDGFKEHGCNCSGCRHIFLLGLGPDFKTNTTTDLPAGLIDISATIAYMLNFQMPTSKGRVLTEMFK